MLTDELVLREESVLGDCDEAIVAGAEVVTGAGRDVVTIGSRVEVDAGTGLCAVAVEGQAVVSGAEKVDEVLDAVGSDIVGTEGIDVELELASEVNVFRVIMLSAKLEVLKVGAVTAGGKVWGEEAGLDNNPNRLLARSTWRCHGGFGEGCAELGRLLTRPAPWESCDCCRCCLAAESSSCKTGRLGI